MEKETATSTRGKLPWNTRTHESSSVFSRRDKLLRLDVFKKGLGSDSKTNKSLCETANSTKSRPSWEEVTIGELKAWIGCLIAMGMDKKPTLQMYWDSTWKLPIVADRFTRDRFLQIKKYLHLADNTAIAEQQASSPDRLAKIRPLIEALLENFQKNYVPATHLTLDEDMCKFKGRNLMKQYMRAKIWKLCDADTAYVLNFDVYTGKQKGKVEVDLASSVAQRLTSGYQGKNHIIIMDNYFTNVPLFLNLLSSSTYACGTIRSNRKYLPESFQEKKVMTQGEHQFWQTDNLVATIWQDKRPVYLLSTCCKATGNDSVSRQGKERKAQLVPCPPSVKLYTSKMGGVDRSDRMVRTYSTSRRGKKWWYRLFCYCVDTALANSYILYSHSQNHQQLTFFQFVEQVALGLVGTTSKVKRVRPSSEKKKKRKRTHPLQVSGEHWPKKTTKRQRCRYCASHRQKKSRSVYACETCDVHLCIDKCFKFYHTRS